MSELTEAIEKVVAGVDFGTASAVKRGRSPEWPYVPVINCTKTKDGSRGYTKNPALRKAFATREEAVAFAQRMIDSYRKALAARLAMPNHRAEREWYGLPREIAKESNV